MNTTKTILLLSTVLISSLALADDRPIEGKIVRIVANTKHIVAEFDTDSVFDVGDTIVVGIKGGRSCETVVESKSGKRASLDLSSCAIFQDISLGEKVERSEFQKPHPIAPLAPEKASEQIPEKSEARVYPPQRLRFGGGVFLNTADRIIFPSAVFHSAAGVDSFGSPEYASHVAPGVQANIGMMEAHHWGFNAGLAYEFPRKVNSSAYGYDNTTVIDQVSASDSITLSLLLVQGNAVYRWNRFYLPFGLNLSLPFTHGADGSSSWNSPKPGLGMQAGAGWFLTECLSAEILLKVVTLEMPEKTSTTPAGTLDYNSGSLSGLQFGLNYWF